MNRAAGVLLRVFSGPHIGAELPLAEGVWVAGTDDSCDLIFHDVAMAPRHAEFVVSPGEKGMELFYAPLEGQVSVAGKGIETGPLPAGTLFVAGSTLLAWLSEVEAVSAPERWRKMAESLAALDMLTAGTVLAAGLPHGEGAEADADEPGKDARGDAARVGTSPKAANMVAATSEAANAVGGGYPDVQMAENSDSVTERRRFFARPGLLLSILAVCAITLSFHGQLSNPEERAIRLDELLRRDGFAKLRAHKDARGIMVSGELDDDAERARLLSVVQRLHYPVYLDVAVRGDRARAVENGFNSRGLFLEARESAPNGVNTLTVSGYVKDDMIEEKAFSGLRADLPSGVLPEPDSANPRLERKIFHADEITGRLMPELAREGLDFVDIVYLPGKVLISGGFSQEQRWRLAGLLAVAQKEMGVNIPFEVWNSPNRPAQSASPDKPGKSQEQRASLRPPPGPGGFTVVGVTMKPLRFVSLKSGERIFEGGQLPGGWVVEAIGVNELQLQKDGHSTIYPLRGGQ